MYSIQRPKGTIFPLSRARIHNKHQGFRKVNSFFKRGANRENQRITRRTLESSARDFSRSVGSQRLSTRCSTNVISWSFDACTASVPTLPPLAKEGDEGMDIDLEEEEEGCGDGGALCFSMAQRNNNKSQYRSQKKRVSY